eukprot:gnl/TRDRNA2_/TRDRNA2_185663_c0_seq1.p1 gnl/TRDRNA2_/TRDRNA2_185663_c0~~gnl/TRDRNA2_/TRDRNA2_185663_c0_seq1.p1  ORF type:complete len:530 (-),score=57.12 gnl/TRDRNA2_/TRDRNA2_185663_c0_seq1:144-1733(-)
MKSICDNQIMKHMHILPWLALIVVLGEASEPKLASPDPHPVENAACLKSLETESLLGDDFADSPSFLRVITKQDNDTTTAAATTTATTALASASSGGPIRDSKRLPNIVVSASFGGISKQACENLPSADLVDIAKRVHNITVATLQISYWQLSGTKVGCGSIIVRFFLFVPGLKADLCSALLNTPLQRSAMLQAVKKLESLRDHRDRLTLGKIKTRGIGEVEKKPMGCITIGPEGAGPDKQCAFPFKFKGAEHVKCIHDSWNKPWCPIRRPFDFIRGWGACDVAVCGVEAPIFTDNEAAVESACFPGNAKVMSRSGPKEMAQLVLGDEILGFNFVTGKPEFTEVRAWLHRAENAEATFAKVHTDAGDIVVSNGHNMAVGRPDIFDFASNIVVGNALVTPNGTALVSRLSQENGKGLYAPWTLTRSFYVSTTGGFFLAHSLANLNARFGRPLALLFNILEFMVPSIHDLKGGPEMDYLHPVARIFWSTVKVPQHNTDDGASSPHSITAEHRHPISTIVESVAGVTRKILV